MATIAGSFLNLRKISSRFFSFSSSLDKSKKTTVDMKKVLLNKTRVTKEAIQGDKKSFARKKEYFQRKAKEDVIEAREVIFRPINAITKGAKGFLSRTFTGFGKVLGAVFQNVISFDFFDTSNRVRSSLSELGNNFEEMQSQFDEGMKLMTTTLSEGVVTGQDAAPFGTSYESPPGGTTSSSGEWKPLLDLVASKESGGNYEAMYPSTTLPGATKMTIADVARRATGAVGKYQQLPQYLVGRAKAAGLNPDKDLYSPENQDLIAAKVNIGMNRGGNQWLAGKMSTEQFMQGLSQEFAVLPNASGKFYHDGQSSSITSQQVKKSLEQVKSGRNIDTRSSPSPTVSTTVKDELNVAMNKSSLGGLTPGQGFGAYRSSTRSHAGIDIGTYGKRGFYVSFRQSGQVTYARNNGAGYRNLVIIKSGNIEFYFAHLASIFVREGQQYNGQTIGEIGKSGGNYDIHLHFEARPGGKPIDPKPYLGLLSIGRQLTGVAGKPTGAPSPAQVAPPAPSLAQISSPSQATSTQQIQQASKPGQQMVVIDDRKPPQMIPVGGGGGGQPQVIVVGQTLNSFIKNKLLLDLVYT